MLKALPDVKPLMNISPLAVLADFPAGSNDIS
jgi:hypothetical protein